MLNFFKKKEKREELSVLSVDDDVIVAMADGEMIDVTTVPDPVFSEKVMGDSVAFKYTGDKVIICAPANGTISVLFPTGHAFGIAMKNGVELLIHIGINTVETNGDGFRLLDKKQDDSVRAGEPIIEVDLKKLSQKYDMSTMLIITDADEKNITFREPCMVTRGQRVIQ